MLRGLQKQVLADQVWSTYSPVKNNPADALAKVEAGGPSHSATSGELDIYQVNCRSGFHAVLVSQN